MRKVHVFQIAAVVFCFFVLGCSLSAEQQALASPQVHTPSLVASRTAPLAAPTPQRIMATPGPLVQTASSDERFTLLRELALSQGECKLPCWLSIQPGSTSVDDALASLNQLRAIADYFNVETDKIDVGFFWETGRDYVSLNTTYYTALSKPEDLVRVIRIRSDASRWIADGEYERAYDSPYYLHLFEHLTLPDLIKSIGKPKQVFLEVYYLGGEGYWIDTNIRLLYPELGIFANYSFKQPVSSIAERFQFCPKNTFFTFWLLPPDAEYEDILLRTDRAVWEDYFPRTTNYVVLLNEASDLSVDDFYNQLLVNKSFCFYAAWPEWLK